MPTTPTTLDISWQRLVQDGATCERCGDTGQALERLKDRLAKDLETCHVRVTLRATELDSADLSATLASSNRVLFNGRPVEELVGARVTATECPSCAELTGAPCDCRAIELDGQVFEALPDELLYRAARAALKLP